MEESEKVVIGVATEGHVDAVFDQFEAVFVLVSRAEVETMATERVVNELAALTATRERVRRFEGAVAFAFEGWEADERGLWEIPGCVQFMAEVTAHWGYWLHYLMRDEQLFGCLLQMLCRRAAVAAGRVDSLTEAVSAEEVLDVVRELFGPMNELHVRHGISLEENKAMTGEVMDLVDAVLV